jgi:hypothetical protein
LVLNAQLGGTKNKLDLDDQAKAAEDLEDEVFLLEERARRIRSL